MFSSRSIESNLVALWVGGRAFAIFIRAAGVYIDERERDIAVVHKTAASLARTSDSQVITGQ